MAKLDRNKIYHIGKKYPILQMIKNNKIREWDIVRIIRRKNILYIHTLDNKLKLTFKNIKFAKIAKKRSERNK